MWSRLWSAMVVWLRLVVGRYGQPMVRRLREKSPFQPSLVPGKAMPTGGIIFLGGINVELCSSPLTTALALEGNFRFFGYADGGVFVSFSSLEP